MGGEGITDAASSFLVSGYNSAMEILPEDYRIYATLAFYIVIIAVYAVFVWKFYRFLARRDIIRLDLRQYNTGTNPGWRKLFAVLLYMLEYIIIMPFLIFFWFAILAVFILLLAKNQETIQVILIAASVIGAIRITSYISEDLSKDLAKMLPFTLLGFFILDPSFFSVKEFITRIGEIPGLIQQIFMYLIFIFILEIILRGIFAIVDLFRTDSEYVKEETEKGY